MNQEKEEWKSVSGYEGIYEVSNLGNIRSLDRETIGKGGKIRRFKGKKLKTTFRNGYLCVNLRRDLSTKTLYVHLIVASNFINNPYNLPQIDHINTIRTDNRVENLRWCTAKENIRNPITRQKLIKNCYTSEECNAKRQDTRDAKGLNKKVYTYNRDGYLNKEYGRASVLAKELNVAPARINDACRCGYAIRGVFCSYDKKERIKHKYTNKQIAQYTKDGVFLRFWDSIKDAQEFYNVKCIGRVCSGGRKTCAGFVWRYINY